MNKNDAGSLNSFDLYSFMCKVNDCESGVLIQCLSKMLNLGCKDQEPKLKQLGVEKNGDSVAFSPYHSIWLGKANVQVVVEG